MATVAPLGPVYQAGTLSGNPLATAAGLAVLDLLDDGAYADACAAGPPRWPAPADGLAAAGVPRGGAGGLDARGPVLRLGPARRLRRRPGHRRGRATPASSTGCSTAGVALAPGAYEVMFPGLAHSDEVLATRWPRPSAAAATVRSVPIAGSNWRRDPRRHPDRLGSLADPAAPPSPSSPTGTPCPGLGRRPHPVAGRSHRDRRPARLDLPVADMAARLDDLVARGATPWPARRPRARGWGWAARASSPRCWPATPRRRRAAPTLTVLDTTDPAAMARVAAECRPAARCSWPPRSRAPRSRPAATSRGPGSADPDPARFAVITDPGSELAALAADRGFAAVFENPPDIGGRYSALSLFGLVPAACWPGRRRRAAGLARRWPTGCRRRPPATPPPGWPPSWPPASGRAGQAHLRPARGLAAFGLWLEQLVAESTGKDGTGVVPVVGEPLGAPDVPTATTGCSWRSATPPSRAAPAALAPPATRSSVLPRRADFRRPGRPGRAVGAGHRPGRRRCSASSPSTSPTWPRPRPATAKVLDGDAPGEPTTPLADLLDQVRPGDYLAIQAFVDPGSPVVDELEAAPRAAGPPPGGHHRRARAPVPALHRPAPQGRPPHGVFVQVVGDDPRRRRRSPGSRTASSTLKQAQAAGDLLALADRGRRAGRVALDELLGGGAVKLGMVGLGQDGRQHGRAAPPSGHEVVGYDAFSEATRRGSRWPSWSRPWSAPGRVGDGAGRRPHRGHVVDDLGGLLAAGDVVVDGGNSNWHDSMRAAASWRAGIGFVDCGTSGGVWGRDEGYCLMVGGAADDVGPASRLRRPQPRPGGFAHVGPSAPGTSPRWSTTASSTG